VDDLTEVIQLDLLPLVQSALKETAKLIAAVDTVASALDTLRMEVAEGDLRDTNRFLSVLIGQLGGPYERR
jgi:hypothetical protein